MGVKISALPAIVTPALTDVFPVVQAGVTYKETGTQLSALLATVAATTITGTANQVIASAAVGPVTLSLPQSIATTSDVTFGSVTFSPTTKGIVGTPTNNNAAASYVGEVISSNLASGSATALTTATPKNVTSISLTAGDWDVYGNVFFIPSVGASGFSAVTSVTSATFPDTSLYAQISAATDIFTNTSGLTAPPLRVSIAGTTTVYLVALSIFGGGTVSACGNIWARRAR